VRARLCCPYAAKILTRAYMRKRQARAKVPVDDLVQRWRCGHRARLSPMRIYAMKSDRDDGRRLSTARYSGAAGSTFLFADARVDRNAGILISLVPPLYRLHATAPRRFMRARQNTKDERTAEERVPCQAQWDVGRPARAWRDDGVVSFKEKPPWTAQAHVAARAVKDD